MKSGPMSKGLRKSELTAESGIKEGFRSGDKEPRLTVELSAEMSERLWVAEESRQKRLRI